MSKQKITHVRISWQYSRTLTRVIPLLAICLSSGALGQGSLSGCSQIQESEARLQCYDEVMAGSNESSLPVIRLPRAPRQNGVSNDVVDAEQPQADNGRVDEFGLEGKTPETDDNSTRVYSVADASHNDFTGWSVEFENGQVWHQIGTDDYDIQVGERYTIERALMNSFLLSNSSNNRKIRVRRIR